MATAPDVVVVGGGVVGAACARQLAHDGRRIRLIERGGEAGEAWRASAGMLAPQIGVSEGDEMFELGIAGRRVGSGVVGTERARGQLLGDDPASRLSDLA